MIWSQSCSVWHGLQVQIVMSNYFACEIVRMWTHPGQFQMGLYCQTTQAGVQEMEMMATATLETSTLVETLLATAYQREC